MQHQKKKATKIIVTFPLYYFITINYFCWTMCTESCVKKADEASDTGSQAIEGLWSLDEMSLVVMAQIHLSGHSQAVKKNVKFQI